MKADQELTMERSPSLSPDNRTQDSTLKSILLHVQDDASLDRQLETALSLARASSAHLSCIHVTPIQAFVAFDSFGGVFVMKDVMKAIDEQAMKLRSRLEAKLKAEDVSWDYEEITGDVPSQIINRAALADLVVSSREPRRQDFVGSAIGLLGDLLYRCRSPLFIPGDHSDAVDVAGIAVVAWDGSYEAANAVRSSVGLLKLAARVTVVQVAEEKGTAFPGTKMLEYLSRHGIHAELVIQDPPGGYANHETVAATLVSHARGLGAAYMVMGGYSHTRIGEYVFGGVTRTLLTECPVSLVVAH